MKTLIEKIKAELMGFDGRMGIAIEVQDGESFTINGDQEFPSASIIKLPILLAALIKAKVGEIDLDQVIKISNKSKVGGSGVIQALSKHASLSIKDLLTLMISVSDNTATNMIIDMIGMDAINDVFNQVGLTNTVLQRKMMDFQAIEMGKDNLTSPKEMIHCLKLLNGLNFKIGFEGTVIAREILASQQFKNKLPERMDQENIIILNKTGELLGVEHDCAILEYRGRRVYLAVMMDGLLEQYSAKQMMHRIGKYISDYLVSE
jgi:beta-lactamase class A